MERQNYEQGYIWLETIIDENGIIKQHDIEPGQYNQQVNMIHIVNNGHQHFEAIVPRRKY